MWGRGVKDDDAWSMPTNAKSTILDEDNRCQLRRALERESHGLPKCHYQSNPMLPKLRLE